MATGAEEAGFLKQIIEWAWVGICALLGIVWKKHNEEVASIKSSISKVGADMDANVKFLGGRIDAVERQSTPISLFETNRKEVREGQIETFKRLDSIGKALARIEGKLDK